MTPSPACMALIQRFEGFSPVLYRCPAGILSIGYGHVVRREEAFADGVDADRAAALLRADMAVAAAAVARLIVAPLRQSQFDALVSFTLNLGAGRLQMSRLRAVINRGDHAAAPAEFQRWVYAAGRKWPGLVARRHAEAMLYQG